MSLSTAFLFPGQGAQEVGMGGEAYAGSPAARAVFDQADSVLGVPLTKLVLEGPANELVRSHNAQPAILTVSIALLRATQAKLGGAMPEPSFVAGHSLGEFSALVAAGALEFAEAVRLVRRRGELMQAAAEATPSGMAALIGMKLDSARRACDGTGAQVANANSEEQIVIAGPMASLIQAIDRAKAGGARRALPLEVAGAFHTEVMRPAQVEMNKEFANAAIRDPRVPVVGNTTGRPLTTAEEVRAELADQLCGCVYWQQSIEYMGAHGVRRFVEIGPGKVLTGLAKRIVPEAEAMAVGNLDGIGALT